jgi:hypothetical protein
MSQEASVSSEATIDNGKPQMSTSTKSLFNDLTSLRLDPGEAASGAVEVLTRILVRKPQRHEFFRVHPDHVLDSTVFTDKEDRESFYFVTPTMRGPLVGEARPVLLVPAVTRQNALFIWPVSLPSEDGRRNAWTETAQEAMYLAREHWVRLAADMSWGTYRIYRAEGQLSDPVWPDKPFEELLEIAFKDRVIDSPDHPVLRRLRGLS